MALVDVRKPSRVNPSKPVDPDNMPGRVLRACTALTHMSQAVVHTNIKKTTIIPVPNRCTDSQYDGTHQRLPLNLSRTPAIPTATTSGQHNYPTAAKVKISPSWAWTLHSANGFWTSWQRNHTQCASSTQNQAAHRGCVLSALLSMLFTHYYTAKSKSNIIVKFSDKLTVVALSTAVSQYWLYNRDGCGP